MVSRRALWLLWLLAACRDPAGSHYEVRITPTPLAAAMATSLDLRLIRTDTSETITSTAALPSPTPTAPWVLDLYSGRFGGSPLSLNVDARANGATVASGQGTLAAGVIAVTLADVAPVDGGMTVDLATVPDLASTPDLTAPCNSTQVGINVPDADSVIINGSGLNFGGGGLMNISGSLGSVALLRFNIASIPQTATLTDVRLTLSYVSNASDCSASCGSCAALEADGGMQMYFMTSDWVESVPGNTSNDGVAWTRKSLGRSWGAAGATGSSDRSAQVASSSIHTSQMPTTFVVDSARLGDLALWRTSTEVSFQVVPLVGRMIAASKEQATLGCGTYVPAKLSITYCP